MLFLLEAFNEEPGRNELMNQMILTSPAKLNLVLDVLGKRPDGFHELRTLFERIDLCDTITLSARKDSRIKVICDHPHVPKGPTNLVVRVAAKLQAEHEVKAGVDIKIEKRIPVAAGLAGGSSNAATVLMGLNRFWKLGLDQKHLVSIAAQIGSDVAFFIHDTPYALGTSRGEVIKALPVKQKLWHVLVTPKVKMLTKDVFRVLNAKPLPSKKPLTSKSDNVSILLPFLRENMLSQLGDKLVNDLEPAILSLRPDFALIKKKLSRENPCGVCFSGSGPSVFALAKSQAHAKAIMEAFDQRYAQVFVVGTLL